MVNKPGHVATPTELASLAAGRETLRQRRIAGMPKQKRHVRKPEAPARRVKGAGHLHHCPCCGETLSSPARGYACPKGKPGYIDLRTEWPRADFRMGGVA